MDIFESVLARKEVENSLFAQIPFFETRKGGGLGGGNERGTPMHVHKRACDDGKYSWDLRLKKRKQRDGEEGV